MSPRQPIALLVSLLTHGMLVGGVSLGFQLFPPFEMPEFELEFTEVELLDPDAIQGEQPVPEPEPPPPLPAPPPSPDEPGPKPEEPKPEEPKPEEPKPEKKFAAKGSRADRLSPPSSTFHMLLVPKKIRRLPFREQVLDIMAPLPDFELLVDQGRLDALRDFNHIVIASPDIRDQSQTFLAVDYRISRAEMQRAIERAAAANDEVVQGVDDGNRLRANPRPRNSNTPDRDDRWFVFLDDNIAIYVRNEFLPSILEGPRDDGRKTSGNFVANLSRLRRVAARQPKAGMQLKVSGITRNLKKSTLPFKVPDTFEVSISAEKRPEVLIRGDFVNVVEAKAFSRWWTQAVRKYIEGNLVVRMNLGALYDALELERDGKTIRLRATVDTDLAVLVMKFAAGQSRKIADKSREDIERMRQRRVEAHRTRKRGKLPPSAVDAPTNSESAGVGSSPASRNASGKTRAPASPARAPTPGK